MTRLFISGEQEFFISKHSFAISASTSGYTLQQSSNHKPEGQDVSATWSDVSDTIPANKQHNVVGMPSNLWYRLHNNTASVIITI